LIISAGNNMSAKPTSTRNTSVGRNTAGKHATNTDTASSSPAKLGDLLIQAGALSKSELAKALTQQAISGRPLGAILEEQFNIPAAAITQAWAAQMAALSPQINPLESKPQRDALALVNRRQAWQFGVLPVSFVDHQIVIVTTQRSLPRAVRFAYKHLGPACTFALCDEADFLDSLDHYYPMPGARECLLTSTLS
jgi:hypothetical protein